MRKLSHWLERLSAGESFDIYRDLSWVHACRSGPFRERLCTLLKRGDAAGLVNFEIDYHIDGLQAHHVIEARQAIAYFQKLKDLDIGVDRESEALKKFLEAEKVCKDVNDILLLRRRGGVCFPPRVEAALFAAQRKIARVLGSRPAVDELKLRFGPGATRGTKRSRANARAKLSETLSCSENLLPVVPALLREMPHLLSLHESSCTTTYELEDREGRPVNVFEHVAKGNWDQFSDTLNYSDEAFDRYLSRSGFSGFREQTALVPVQIVPAKLGFVPKNAKSLRSVCTEAGLNVMFQLGVGDFMARRLAAFGIDITDQSLNQRRAREGSLTGALATLDLSSASDTISREIVYELLPLDWAVFLNYGRSPQLELPSGQLIEQSKFASMGNGFTFPLETLIFWGLAAGCCDDDEHVSVYGDDIIVPTDRAELLCEVLHYCGFMVNKGKSYVHGPFRESCGKDYFRGIDVRPVYPRDWVSARGLFVLHNFYARRGDEEMAKKVESFIHPSLLIYGPDGYGDGHLVSDTWCRSRPDHFTASGYAGHLFETFVKKVPRSHELLPGDRVLPVYSVYMRAASQLHPLVPVDEAPLKIPEKVVDGCAIKDLPLPVTDEESGYKKIKIYTLNGD